MTLFPFDDVLDVPLRDRVAKAEVLLERLVANKESGVVSDVGERVRRFAQRGDIPLIVKERELFADHVKLKHGPFIEYLAKKDLRPLRDAITRPSVIPRSSLIVNGSVVADIPTQVPVFRTGFPGYRRHEILWTDVFAAWDAYKTIRKQGKVVRREAGMTKVEYGPLTLTIHGLRKERNGTFDAWLEGIPSTSKPGIAYKTRYLLEATADGSLDGVFKVDSGYPPERSRNWVTYLYREDKQSGTAAITKHDPRTNRQPSVEREALYTGDLLGLFLIQGFARRTYNIDINTPLPLIPDQRLLELAKRIGEDAIIIDEEGKRHRPSKTRWNQLYSMALAQP